MAVIEPEYLITEITSKSVNPGRADMRDGRVNFRLIQRFAVAILLVMSSVPIVAQAPAGPQEHHHEQDVPATASWSWSGDANLFVGYNSQQRKYANFTAWESQNWAMLDGRRRLGPGTLAVGGMLSLEPFTLHAEGSPQLFQTGESYQQIPLVNLQHPHDLLMGLGATYRIDRPRIAYLFSASLVGSPALGPTAFMHRESARDNPQAPLSHHSLDSTHITPGVVTAGIATGAMTIEASSFRGEEPDENRLDVERPRLNSFSARLGWRRGPWDAQFSGGRLHDPEWFEPYMVTRLTASIGFNGAIGSRTLSATAAWGENRENNGYPSVDDSYLLEWDLGLTRRAAFYGRAEQATKQILGLGLHPRGFTHPHFYSHVGALTVGGVFDLPVVRANRLGVGADFTGYRMSPEMADLYEGSFSYHVFLRWRPAVTSMRHVH
jgi:hypothetical protein